MKKSIEANLEMITIYDRVIGDLKRDIIKSAVNHDPIAYALLNNISTLVNKKLEFQRVHLVLWKKPGA